MGAQVPGRTDNACWRRSKTLAAMERGTARAPGVPRGSGGRFLPRTAQPGGAAEPRSGPSTGERTGAAATQDMKEEADAEDTALQEQSPGQGTTDAAGGGRAEPSGNEADVAVGSDGRTGAQDRDGGSEPGQTASEVASAEPAAGKAASEHDTGCARVTRKAGQIIAGNAEGDEGVRPGRDGPSEPTGALVCGEGEDAKPTSMRRKLRKRVRR